MPLPALPRGEGNESENLPNTFHSPLEKVSRKLSGWMR